MPARIVQRVDSVPVDEWRPLCLECGWMGDHAPDEVSCARQAYEHNQARHDGAGVEAQLSDFTQPVEDQLKHYVRMYRMGCGTALFTLMVGVWSAMAIDNDPLRGLAVGLNMATGGANWFMAGKWARRIEAVTIG